MSILDGTLRLQADEFEWLKAAYKQLMDEVGSLKQEIKRFNDFCDRIKIDSPKLPGAGE